MQALALPPFEFRCKPDAQQKGRLRIWDIVRKKYVLLTPEEWVRQHFLHYLIYHLDYPIHNLAVEQCISYGQTRAKRADIVVYELRTGKKLMIVECKAAEVSLSAHTIQQAALYNSQLQCSFVVITNGIEIYTWQISSEGIQPSELPHFTTLLRSSLPSQPDHNNPFDEVK